MTIRLTYVIFFVYVVVLWLFLNIWGIDALNGVIDFQFYADSGTYMGFAKDGITFLEMAVFNPNLIGPVYLVRFLNNSYNLIFIFNVSLLFYSYKLITKHFNVNRYLLLFLWILSPMMISSILSINKEIIAVLSTVLLMVYIKKEKLYYLAVAIVLSLFVRWQQIVFIILIAGLFSKFNPLKKRLVWSFILLLVASSIFYPLFMLGHVEDLQAASEKVNDTNAGTGIYFLFNNLQAIPLGYLIIFIPKLIFTLFSTLTKVGSFGAMDDFYNNTVVFSQCVCYLIVSILLLVKKKISLNNIFFFNAMIYCILFTLSPIFAPRYLFMFYILSSVTISEITPDQLKSN